MMTSSDADYEALRRQMRNNEKEKPPAVASPNEFGDFAHDDVSDDMSGEADDDDVPLYVEPTFPGGSPTTRTTVPPKKRKPQRSGCRRDKALTGGYASLRRRRVRRWSEFVAMSMARSEKR